MASWTDQGMTASEETVCYPHRSLAPHHRWATQEAGASPDAERKGKSMAYWFQTLLETSYFLLHTDSELFSPGIPSLHAGLFTPYSCIQRLGAGSVTSPLSSKKAFPQSPDFDPNVFQRRSFVECFS
uniref:Uncharacterized protein n=1 Tax=Rousettus aegyptiacus TaxID=9407 RepID=A0A7J8F0T5_ROUAE|nr:hypothetical protein HJG63_012413 [Rousettus aegyptiacus]